MGRSMRKRGGGGGDGVQWKGWKGGQRSRRRVGKYEEERCDVREGGKGRNRKRIGRRRRGRSMRRNGEQYEEESGWAGGRGGVRGRRWRQ